jgi:para-aminobenzoate synthetase component 1
MSAGLDQLWLNKLLHHFRHARHLALYNSNRHQQAELPMGYLTFDWLLAISEGDVVPLQAPYLDALDHFVQERPDFYCGFISYDLKNELETLQTRQPDHLAFSAACFFRPQLLFVCSQGELKVIRNESDTDWDKAKIEALADVPAIDLNSINLQCRTSRDRYLSQVEQIRTAIAEGTVYELNYCMEWYAEAVKTDPIALYRRLNQLSPTPFSAYFQSDGQHLICGSPERFFARYQQTLFSQPIKGTRKRSSNASEDAALKLALANDEKEKAENVMIVDLVRNDLARSCTPGSVKVPELMQVYTFPTVHQLISTVTGTIRPEVSTVQALKNAFPMGSMTGAPKIKAMETIDSLEDSRRGLYSGSVGYFSPDGNCDFNVIIRSILYNSRNGYLNFQTGGAITYDSVPEQEWEECQLKAATMLAALDCEK